MSTKPSIYEEATLQSASNVERTVDIKLGILSIDYYESVLTPAISMKVNIVDSGGSIRAEGSNELTTIYQGLPVVGKEKLILRVKPNSPNNVALDFTANPLIVRGASNAILGSKKQVFSLDLVSAAGINNEVSFINENWNDVKISDIASTIVRKYLGYQGTRFIADESINTIGFGGNQMKPFKALTQLAKKAIYKNGVNSSAGFLLYETKSGIRFCAIDHLITAKPKAEYFYTEVNVNEADFVPSPTLPSLDRKILQYNILKNEDIIQNLKTGAYATERRFFDPTNFRVTNQQQGFFGPRNYTSSFKMPSLGAIQSGKQIFDSITGAGSQGDEKLIAQTFNKPSRILSESISRGTYDSSVTKATDVDIFKNESQSLVRYNSLFSQCISILVPLNSNLEAGNIIKINIPETNSSNRDRIDSQISGNYMIKELCHHYEADGSFTKMKIVRDTSGIKKS